MSGRLRGSTSSRWARVATGVGSRPGSLKTSSKRSLTNSRIEGTVRKFVVRARTSPPLSLHEALRLVVDRDVGAAEAVDGLLGVADDEELAGLQAAAAPVFRRLPFRVLGQEERELRLEGVGVLELVHEDVVEAPLEVAAHRDRRWRRSRARRRRSWKSTTAAFAFASLVGFQEAPQLVAQGPVEVGVRGLV